MKRTDILQENIVDMLHYVFSIIIFFGTASVKSLCYMLLL